MTYDSVHECEAKIYKTGLIVLYKHRVGRAPEDLKIAAKEPRHFKIRRSEVSSAAINLWQKKKFRIWFLTITFAFDPNKHELEASRSFNNWLKNLRTNYSLNNYLYVKEKGNKGKRIHYHLLIDSPRLNIRQLQNCFNISVKNIDSSLNTSSNSVRLGANPYVQNIYHCAKYMSKYINKTAVSSNYTEVEKFKTKAYGFTNEISNVCTKVDGDILEKLAEKFDVKHVFEDSFFVIFILKGYNYSINLEKLIAQFENFT